MDKQVRKIERYVTIGQIKRALMDALVEASEKAKENASIDNNYELETFQDGVAVGLHRAIDIIEELNGSKSCMYMHDHEAEPEKCEFHT